MKRFGLVGVYEWGLLAVLFLIVLHAPLIVGIGTLLPGYATILKTWKEIVLAALGIIAIVLVTRRHIWDALLGAWPIRLSLAFIVLHLLLAATLGGEPSQVVAGLMIDLRFIVMFLLAYVLVLLRPAAPRRIVLSVCAGMAVVLGFGLLQITVLPDGILRSLGYSPQTITPYTTIDSNPEYVRINSTLRGPNPLGAVTVIYAALAAAYLVYRSRTIDFRRRGLAAAGLAASMAVLFATYSRSAYIALVVAIGLIVIVTIKLSRHLIISGVVAAVLLSAGLFAVSTTDWFSNVVLHEDPESLVASKSNAGHVESLATGTARATTKPLGAGIGSTGSATLYDRDHSNDAIIENYYLFVAHESGWLGLGLFLALLGVVLATLWRKRSDWTAMALFASGVGLAVIGLLLPVWADETVALIWWGLAGALAAPSGIIGGRHGRTTGKQTTTRTS